jgi:hypothetical protein
MLRDSRVLTVTIPAYGSLSDAFDMGPFAGGYLSCRRRGRRPASPSR